MKSNTQAYAHQYEILLVIGLLMRFKNKDYVQNSTVNFYSRCESWPRVPISSLDVDSDVVIIPRIKIQHSLNLLVGKAIVTLIEMEILFKKI